jgi:hypothetical protein
MNAKKLYRDAYSIIRGYDRYVECIEVYLADIPSGIADAAWNSWVMSGDRDYYAQDMWKERRIPEKAGF